MALAGVALNARVEPHVNPQLAYQESGRTTRSIGMSFLHWVCERSVIDSYGTCWQYFRQFKQLYTYATGKRIFSGEKHRVNLAGIYIGLACTGARPAEFVDDERKSGKDLEELFPRRPKGAADEDENAGWLGKELTRYTVDRGRPKTLCWEDTLLMVVRHPATGEDILAMSIKFAHHKGADNKPKPTGLFFTPARRLIFCLINVIVCLAVLEGVFAASDLTSARQVYQIKNQGPVTCTPLRWKEEWLKEPVFRRCDDSIPEDESDNSVRSKYRVAVAIGASSE
ncbi:hypothetical protein M406DRAFT_73780 [Cryphonectria parasitica EP155]|uniref:Uncharacterized protein n=1 Tax=Cryphonectria parasitica (strain ATCC 38755 / EP155) TaxID=660469 RepID=A0A9P4XYB0_CRYP1|nr:uncharacterized protein M406DRAFT_73780 [Cryphonectria parasitica EP155]KAF3763133.1 hypothetical protein M406DRAFT_73780 [Cryphonectria parasitica EP155]